MAVTEAIIDIPAIPKVNENGSVHARRHSIGSVDTSKASTGKVMVPNGGLTVFSRYLRTSQGSCHDLCKYGTHLTLETESKSPRFPMPKIVAPKHGVSRTLERNESKLGERRRKSEVGLKFSPDFKSQEPDEPAVIKSAETQDKHHVENAKTNITDDKKSEIALKSSCDTEPQKPDHSVVSLEPSPDDLVDIKSIAPEGEVQDVENAETKLSTGEKKPEVSGKSKGEMTMSKGIRTSVMGDKKNAVPPSVSLFPEKSGASVSNMNIKKKKSRGVFRSKKKESTKQIKPEKSGDINAKGSEKQKGVSHLMDQENVQKHNSEPANIADIPEKTLFMIGSNPENTPAESIQNSVHANEFSTIPSSSSKDKSMKHTRNVNPTGRSPRSYEKRNMIYKPKGILACVLPTSSSSFPGKKCFRSTPYGLNATQPPLPSPSSKSPQGDAPSEHNEVTAQRPKGRSKMMYKSKPKIASITTSKDKLLQGKKLNFQRGKVIQVPLDDYTPRRLAFKQRVINDNINGKDEGEGSAPKRLKFRQRGLVDNRNGDNQNGISEGFTARRLKFRKRVLVDNRNAVDNQNDRGKEFTARTLKFRQRAPVENKNANDNQNDGGEGCTPRKLKFRGRALDDNKTDYIQNGEGHTAGKNNSEGKEHDFGQANTNEVQSDKISLRYNDDEIKKDLGLLYNKMIEETTTRLVRTNSSKVKALVSAFESVISHLDTGFSATNNIP